MRRVRRLFPLAAAFALLGLGMVSRPPIPTVPKVDLDRFMGDWYIIMARGTPKISEADYEALAAKVAALGYDGSRLQRVPQSW